ncbi:hypothetical protein ACLSYN_10490, partial [Avibacterium avium]|uniref:hypothetical protein n=1 Tax=Avibacterium avium TaxID=751 RepID=UPI003BF8AE3C
LQIRTIVFECGHQTYSTSILFPISSNFDNSSINLKSYSISGQLLEQQQAKAHAAYAAPTAAIST